MAELKRRDWKNIQRADIEKELHRLLESSDTEFCSVDRLKRFVDTTRKSTCGECALCREGILQIYLIIKDITESQGKEGDIAVIKEIAGTMMELASCEYGKVVGRIVDREIKNYEEDFARHLSRKRCDSLICKEYFSVHVLGEKCIGCGKCKKVCNSEAIDGDYGLIHVINQKNCIKCLACLEECAEGAIIKAGAVKPKSPDQPIPVGTFKPVGLGGGLMRKRRLT